MKIKTKTQKTRKPAVRQPLTDRQMFDQALEAVGYWSDEAKKWQEFAADTQDVCLRQQQRLEALEQEIRRLSAPRVGCDECEYTGFLNGAVDDVLPSGEVVQRVILCPHCRPVLDEFIDSYIKNQEMNNGCFGKTEK